MGRRRTAVWLAAALGASMLGGCAQKQVDYVEENAQGSSGNTDTLKERFGTGTWKESLTMSWGEELEIPVEINAEITVPDAEQMSVVEVTGVLADEDGKESLLRNLFGDKIWYFDEEYRTREDLEVLLEPVRERAQALSEDLEENYREADEGYWAGEREILKEYQETIEYYEKLMETAPDSYELAEQFSGSGYLVEYGGTEYTVAVEETEVTGGLTYLTAFEMTPKTGELPFDLGYEIGSVEVKDLTEQAAREQAETFLEQAGFSWYVETDVACVGWESDSDDSGESYGYVFTYGPGVDGIDFLRFGTCKNYQIYKDERASVMSDASRIKIYVTPEYGISVYMDNPVELVSVTVGVGLLGLDEIEAVMRGAVGSGCYYDETWDNAPSKITVNALSLIYLRIWDGVSEESYSYVPVWRLCEISNKTALWIGSLSDGDYMFYELFVNAMDGTVIDVTENY